MKSRFAFAWTALVCLLGSSTVFAAFTIEEIHQAAKLATSAFQTANPEHAPHFNGYKVWPSGEDAKVKVYVTHEGVNLEFNYLCHKHDGITECHTQ